MADYIKPPVFALMQDKPIQWSTPLIQQARWNANTKTIFDMMKQGQIPTPTEPFDLEVMREQMNQQISKGLTDVPKYNQNYFIGPLPLPKRQQIPYKGIVFHRQSSKDRNVQLQNMSVLQRGYNILVGDDNVLHYADPKTLAQHIKPPQHEQRKKQSIVPEIREKYKEWSNSNTFSIAIPDRVTETNAPIIFDVAARAFAKHNIPLSKDNIIGHGELQHGDGREKLGPGGLPEGQEMRELILNNWDLFSERVNSYKKGSK